MDAAVFRAWIVSAAAVVEANRDHLTQLDAAIGDADHGTNLARGFTAVLGALDAAGVSAEPMVPGAVLTLTGNTLISKVGGASGPLYGTAFRRAGKALGDAADVDLPALAAALEAALAGVQQLGAAREGDKTMVDALAPGNSGPSARRSPREPRRPTHWCFGRGRRGRRGGDHPDAGAEGPGELSRAAQRRPRRSWRRLHRPHPRRPAGRGPEGHWPAGR